MISVQVQHYLGRAKDFVEGMRFLREDLRYSAALLGIHGAISYCDALRVGLGSSGLSSENHATASNELKSLLAGKKLGNPSGADRLTRLLAKKSRIAYMGTSPDRNELAGVIQDAERFAVWAEAAGKELQIEGWPND